MSVNKVFLVGHVGQDPEVRFNDEAGKPRIISLSLATTERGYIGRDGNQVPDKTTWHNLVFKGSLAEIAHTYLHKGSRIYVEGRLNYRTYDKDGVTHHSTEIIINELEMLSPKKSDDAQPSV